MVPSCATAAADGHGRAHQHREGAPHAPPLPGAAALRPQLLLHAALSRRLPDAHQDPAVPRLHRARRLQERRAQAARGPALPGHPRARLPAALRGALPPPARRAPDHHLLAAPLHGRPVHRRGAGRASCCCRSSPRPTAASASPSSAAARPGSPAPSTPGSRGTPSRSSRRCPSRAACCATASRATVCRATCSTRSSTCSGAWAWSCECDNRLGVDFQLEDLLGRVRRRLPGSRRLQLQRDGRRERGRRRRRHRGRLPRGARAHRRRARRPEGHRHRRRLHGHGRLPHLHPQGRQGGHVPLPPLAQGDARPPHRGRRGRGGGRQARAAGALR